MKSCRVQENGINYEKEDLFFVIYLTKEMCTRKKGVGEKRGRFVFVNFCMVRHLDNKV